MTLSGLEYLLNAAVYQKKLMMNWDGPYKIIGKLTDVTYRIQKSPKSKPLIVHYNRLKPYKGKLPGWYGKT
jgi:tRNA A37 threonylcarbamoyladenosine synthetase subunit TsaC/SUA5/YrdC